MSKHSSITCSQCGNTTPTGDSIPKFCSHCGARFETIVDGEGISEVTRQQIVDRTIAAQSPRPEDISLDETHDSSFVFKAGNATGKLQPGDHVGPFQLGCVLGSGGMGTVYEAHDTDRDCPVALKLLSRQVHATSEAVERFKRESQVAASINHPGSTFVYRSGKYGDQFFIAMELMNGGTLKDVVEAEGPLEVSRAVDFMIQAIDGLAVAHGVGIVHRDFKPSNCFVDDDGRAKVGDFGLAKNFFGDVALTQTGTFVGTPQFAAPEQLRAGHVDARTDIYAVAGSLFYLLTGRAPFVGDAAQVISGIAAEQAPNIRTIAPHVPEKLAVLIAQMLEKDPSRRPGSLQEIKAGLLPFSSLGAVAPDNGLRMAAFFIDLFILGFVEFLVTATASPFALLIGPDAANVMLMSLGFFVMVGWFAIQEYVGGTTIGKWLMSMRVVNEKNDSPRLWQACLRPLMIPGLRQILVVAPFFFIESKPAQVFDMQGMLSVSLLQLLTVLSWIPCVLVMLTARASNGYRGLHDLLTKTRVVSISSAILAKTPDDIAVTTPLPLEPDDFNDDAVSPFEVLGQFGTCRNSGERILVGKDPELDRSVWIYETKDADPPITRAAIRPSRQRMIATRVDDTRQPPRHYFIAECTEGMPLVQFIDSSLPIQWTTFRPVLRELASELADSEDENSLPDNFSSSNVWLDRSGQLKLVEVTPEAAPNDTASPRDVFAEVVSKIIARHPVPSHVIEMAESWNKAEDNSMANVVDQLDEVANKPSGWTWIDRIGATCVLLAVEMSTLFLLGQLWLALCKTQFDSTVTFLCGSFFISSIVGAFLIGMFFESLSFKFLGVAIRRKDKFHAASPVRLGIRSILAWILPIGLVTAVIAIEHTSVDLVPGTVPAGLIAGLIGVVVIPMLMVPVTLFNLARPSRGVADLLCGTLLMRK